MGAKFVQALPMMFKIGAMILAALSVKNYDYFSTNGGFTADLVQLVAVFGVGTAGLGSLGIGQWISNWLKGKEVTAALNMPAPAEVEAAKDLQIFRLTLPDGDVSISLHATAPAELVNLAKSLISFAAIGDTVKRIDAKVVPAVEVAK